MKTHNEFMEEVIESSREPTLPERTKEALSEELNNTERISEIENE